MTALCVGVGRGAACSTVISVGCGYQFGGYSHQTVMGASRSAESDAIHEGTLPFVARPDVTGGGTTRYSARGTTALPLEFLARTGSFLCSILNLSTPIPRAQPLRFDR